MIKKRSKARTLTIPTQYSRSRRLCFLVVLLGTVLFASPSARDEEGNPWTDEQGTSHYDQLAPHNTWETPLSLNQEPVRQQEAKTPQFSSQPSFTFATGLLWQVVPPTTAKRRIKPSFLLGTIHSEDPRVLQTATQVQAPLAQSKSFCTEMLATPSAAAAIAGSMLYTNGRTLSSVIGESLFHQLSPLMSARGIPEQALQMFKPWAVLMALWVPQQKTGRVLDLLLYENAQQQGKTICGLETVNEQIEIFKKTSLADQLVFLRGIAKDPDALSKQHERLIACYLGRDLAGLLALSRETSPGSLQEQQSGERFFRRLIDDRNRKMVERMLPRLQQGATFIAVGALHLPGPHGILQLLNDRGYAVSPVQ